MTSQTTEEHSSKKDFCLQETINSLFPHIINYLMAAYSHVTATKLLKFCSSIPHRISLDDNHEKNDTRFVYETYIIKTENWEKQNAAIFEFQMRAFKNLEEADRMCHDLNDVTKTLIAADSFFSNVVPLDDQSRLLIDSSFSGLIFTIIQDPLFSFFRYPQNKGVNKSLEQRMEEELDAELLRKHLDPESSSFIEWKYLMAYVRMFPDHHIQAKNLLESSGTITDLATYIPHEIEVRRLIEKLRSKEIDKKNFDRDILRFTAM